MRFWPALILGALIAVAAMLFMPRMSAQMPLREEGEMLKRRARTWMEKSGQRMGSVRERLGRS